jgi:prepilin-type N-terminal cleavage/methylation domain-containing protein
MIEMQKMELSVPRAGLRSMAGFTMVELMVATSVLVVVSAIAFAFMRSGSILTAKSTRLNHSHDELRGSFDRLADHLLAANNVPTLIGTNGVGTTGPAAGLKFDKMVGDPYVLDPPTEAGSLSSTATSLSVWRSTASVATAPIPTIGDVMLIPTPTGNIRARISSVTVHSLSSATQKITLTFSAALGKSLTWFANQPQITKLVRPEAFIVMPANGLNELRFFPQFEPVPSLSDPSKYTVLTNQVGTSAGEGTPFSVLDMNGDRIVQSTLRVRDPQYSRYFAKENNTYSGYFQLLLNLPSRLRPKTTN